MQARIYNISPFDAAYGTTIKFSWSGNQAFGNICVIKDNFTNTEIYSKEVWTFALEHTLDLTAFKVPLQNNKQYTAYITVFDKNGSKSIESVGMLFLCLKKPEFYFTNVSENSVIDQSTYNFQMHYSQENNELLDSWQISVYDMGLNLLSTSGVKYSTDISYTFSGFSDKAKYKIRAVGKTVNGMSINTDYINFSVSYDIAAVFSKLELTNIPERGCILAHSNIISADGEPLYSPITYFNGQYADLRGNEVTYKEGFLLDGDFSFVMSICGLEPNKTFCEFGSDENPDFKATVTYRVGYFTSNTAMQGQLELMVTNGVSSYVLHSNIFNVLIETDIIGFCIVRQNGLYDIQVVNLGSLIVDSIETVEEVSE